MNPPFVVAAAQAEAERPIHSDVQAVLDMSNEEIEAGVAWCAAEFEKLSAEEREQIDAIGRSSRGRMAP
jgi:hypothetical protein